MSSENNKAEGLFACLENEKCWVRVQGRGSFKLSSNLKAFLENAVEEKGVTFISIDLKDCVGMDSTFMGVLAGLSGRLTRKGVDFGLINLDKKNFNLLQTLGIDQVIKHQLLEDVAVEQGSCMIDGGIDLSTPDDDKLTTAETMLVAHQTLADLNDENIGRFQNVINFLEQDVRKLKE